MGCFRFKEGKALIFPLGFFVVTDCFFQSAPDWIRTNDRPLRRRVLYPSELQALALAFVAVRWNEVKIRVANLQNCFLQQLGVPNFSDFE